MILVFTTKTTQPRLQVFSVNGALTFRRLHFWRHFLFKHKILPNLVISNWLWSNYACAFSQSEFGKYFEWIIITINLFGRYCHWKWLQRFAERAGDYELRWKSPQFDKSDRCMLKRWWVEDLHVVVWFHPWLKWPFLPPPPSLLICNFIRRYCKFSIPKDE